MATPSNYISDLKHPLPADTKWPYQHGISDPHWPVIPQNVTLNPADSDSYKIYYAGRVDPQKFVSILRADILAKERAELTVLLQLLTEKVNWYMETKPSTSHVLPMSHKEIPHTYRVTVTVGFGASLFLDKTGYDRFEIHAQKPRFLKTMPAFPGDAATFASESRASDLLIMVCSDHPYVNTAIIRDIVEKFNRNFAERISYPSGYKVLHTRGVEQGFGRPDRREFLRFDDGIDNLRIGDDLESLIYISEKDPEPAWCVNGSYLVYRKIREKLPVWEAFADKTQESMIGREKKTGKPLSPAPGYPKDEAPVFPGEKVKDKTPFDAHIRKVQPRRPGTDLFDIPDLHRRFLRRPYPYFEGINESGEFVNGLHFIAFMKSIQHQFEHVTNMWQMNSDFPVPGTGIDALYAKHVLETVDGGYYFCPPAPVKQNEFLGSGLFE